VNTEVRKTAASMASRLFLDMPNSVVLGIAEMQMQHVMDDIPQLLSILVLRWKNHVIDEVYRCEGYVM
jgi:hypothetical protein